MTWTRHNLVHRFDGDFPEPPDYELVAYGWDTPTLGGRKIDRTRRIKHGTATGYVDHVLRGETACERCTRARASEDSRKRRRARGEAA